MSTEIYREGDLGNMIESDPASVTLSPGHLVTPGAPRSRRWFWATVQVVFGVVALALVLWKADLLKVWEVMARTRWGLVAGAIVLNVTTTVLMALRLGLLGRVHSNRVSFVELIRAQFKAALVNGFVPGSLGGDAVRFYTLERTIKDKALVLATLAVERLVGMWGILLTAGVALFLDRRFLNSWNWGWGALAILALIFGVTGLLFSQRLEAGLLATLMPMGAHVSEWWGMRRMGGIFQRLLEAVRSFRFAQPQLWGALLVSLGVRLVWVLGAYLLALALALPVSLALLFVLISLVDVARMLPIAPPNGLGVREAMLVFLLGQVGIGPEAALGFSLLIYGVMTVNALLGGVLSVTQGIGKLRS